MQGTDKLTRMTTDKQSIPDLLHNHAHYPDLTLWHLGPVVLGVGDGYHDASTGRIYRYTEDGWIDPHHREIGRDDIIRVLTGWYLGEGYESFTVGADDASKMAHAILLERDLPG